jgi:hypothetical protein
MEILVGTNSPIPHQVFWRGEVVDSDSLPSVKIYDITEDPAISPSINPSTLLQTLTAEKDETNIGLYNVYLPLTITNRNKTLKLVWEYNVSSSPVSSTHNVFVVTPYANFSQASLYLGTSTDPSDPMYKSFKDLKMAERYARKKIENYTGQSFYLYDDIQTVYGSGSDVLPLPIKLNELHELYINDVLLYDGINNVNNWGYNVQISETGYGIRINRANMLDNTVYIANGMVPPSINDYGYGAFGDGVKYKVAGQFGWDRVPDEVELACIELMKDFFSADKEWRNKYIKAIQTFDWSFDYNSLALSGTGNLHADQLLADYVITKSVII